MQGPKKQMELAVSLKSQNLMKLRIIDLLGIDRPRHGHVFGKKKVSAGSGPNDEVLGSALRSSVKKPSKF